MLENIDIKEMQFKLVTDFIAKLKRKFGGGNNGSAKVTKLKRVEQGGKTIEEFVQKFRRIVRESRYKRRALVEEFKRRMNRES